MPTVAELRERAKTGPVSLPKSVESVTLTEGQHILVELSKLGRERQQLMVEASTLEAEVAGRQADPESYPPLKSGEKGPGVRLDAVKVQLDANQQAQEDAQARLRDFQGEVGLTGMLPGDWQRWKDAHPPRPDNLSDEQTAAGFCNATDLMASLGTFVTEWDGEAVESGAWDEWLGVMVATADHRDLVTAVVSMHETRVRMLPKSSTASSSTRSSGTD